MIRPTNKDCQKKKKISKNPPPVPSSLRYTRVHRRRPGGRPRIRCQHFNNRTHALGDTDLSVCYLFYNVRSQLTLSLPRHASQLPSRAQRAPCLLLQQRERSRILLTTPSSLRPIANFCTFNTPLPRGPAPEHRYQQAASHPVVWSPLSQRELCPLQHSLSSLSVTSAPLITLRAFSPFRRPCSSSVSLS